MTAADRIRRRLQEEGFSDAEIAYNLQVTRQRVHQVLGPVGGRSANVAAELRRLRAELERPLVGTARTPPSKHGTVYGYNHMRCRCRDCRDAHRLRMRRYYHPHH